MPITTLTTGNTFIQWLGVTNQLVTISNSLNENGLFNTNSTIIISGGGSLNVLGTAILNTVLSNTINVRTLNVIGTGESLNVANSANVRGNIFIGGNVSIGNLVVRGAYTIDNPTLTNLILSGYANVSQNVNVQSSFSQMGPQTSFFNGRLNLNNAEISLSASGNVIVSKNVSVTQNVVVGANLVALRIFGTQANITSLNVSSMNVTNNIEVGGTINTKFINVTSNLVVQNLTVLTTISTQSSTNITGGNISITGVVNTRNLIVSGSVIGNLNVESGNVVINQQRNITPGATGLGQIRVLGSGYNGYFALDGSAMRLGHTSSSRDLTLEVASSPVLTATPTGINIPGALNVTGAISGDASGLTNVNFIASSIITTNNTIFFGSPATNAYGSDGASGTGRTPNWVSTGISLTTTIPTGIDTVDLTISASILIESIGIHGLSSVSSVSGQVTVSQGQFGTTGGTGTLSASGLSLVLATDFAAGAGAPDFRYRVLRNGVSFFDSEWTQLSTPGSFFGILNTIRDTAPITGTASTYTVEAQWRNAADIDEANAGTITSFGYDFVGNGTNFQTYLSPRQRLIVDGVTYSISEVVYPGLLRVQNSPATNFSNRPYTISDLNTIPRLTLRRRILNLVGYRT